MWINIKEKKPENGKLVLVLQDMTGRCLREMHDLGTSIEWYDENNNLDDSELEIYKWCEIPEL